MNFAERQFHVRNSFLEVTRLHKLKEDEDLLVRGMLGSASKTNSSNDGVSFLRGSMNNLRSLGASTRNMLKKSNSKEMDSSDTPSPNRFQSFRGMSFKGGGVGNEKGGDNGLTSSSKEKPPPQLGAKPGLMTQLSAQISSSAKMVSRSSSPYHFQPRRFSQGMPLFTFTICFPQNVLTNIAKSVLNSE